MYHQALGYFVCSLMWCWNGQKLLSYLWKGCNWSGNSLWRKFPLIAEMQPLINGIASLWCSRNVKSHLSSLWTASKTAIHIACSNSWKVSPKSWLKMSPLKLLEKSSTNIRCKHLVTYFLKSMLNVEVSTTNHCLTLRKFYNYFLFHTIYVCFRDLQMNVWWPSLDNARSDSRYHISLQNVFQSLIQFAKLKVSFIFPSLRSISIAYFAKNILKKYSTPNLQEPDKNFLINFDSLTLR